MNTIRKDIGFLLDELGRPITIVFTISTFAGGDIFSEKVEKQFEFKYSDGVQPKGYRYKRRKDFDSADRRRDWLLSDIYFAIDNVFMIKDAYTNPTFDEDELIIGDYTINLDGNYTLDELVDEIMLQVDDGHVLAYNDGGELVILLVSPFLSYNATEMAISGSASVLLGIEGTYKSNAEYNFIYDGKEWDIAEADEGEYKVSYRIVTRQ